MKDKLKEVEHLELGCGKGIVLEKEKSGDSNWVKLEKEWWDWMWVKRKKLQAEH